MHIQMDAGTVDRFFGGIHWTACLVMCIQNINSFTGRQIRVDVKEHIKIMLVYKCIGRQIDLLLLDFNELN